METTYFLGIDISKKKFDAALTVDGKQFYECQVENSHSSIQDFFREIKRKFAFSYQQLTVCLEHTGLYGLPVLDFLVKHNIKVAVEPALQIKQSQGMTRGKTDQVDARRIALYALKHSDRLNIWKPQREVLQKLKALLATRDRLIKAKNQLEVPLEDCADFIDKAIRKSMVDHCRQTLKSLTNDIKEIEHAITELIQQDAVVQQQIACATSVPGIGKITALQMIITTGEFERIQQAKRFACYAGIAPFEHSSGSSFRG